MNTDTADPIPKEDIALQQARANLNLHIENTGEAINRTVEDFQRLRRTFGELRAQLIVDTISLDGIGALRLQVTNAEAELNRMILRANEQFTTLATKESNRSRREDPAWPAVNYPDDGEKVV